jgi:hypothetical protein
MIWRKNNFLNKFLILIIFNWVSQNKVKSKRQKLNSDFLWYYKFYRLKFIFKSNYLGTQRWNNGIIEWKKK